MDNFFFQQEMQIETFWHNIPEIETLCPEAIKQSSFTPYMGNSSESSMESSNSQPNCRNFHRRMIEILRAIRTVSVKNRGPESSQCYRHMISERHRRGKMRQSYVDLHSILPPGTKSDKNSIVQAASLQLLTLQHLIMELQKRNEELQASSEGRKESFSEVEFRVSDPSSAIGSVIKIMKCLKSMELKAKAIRLMPIDGAFKVTVEIEELGKLESFC